MENAQVMKQFLSQTTPGTRGLQIQVSRMLQALPFSAFLQDRSYLNEAYMSKVRANDRKASPLVPSVDSVLSSSDSAESETGSAILDDPARPKLEDFNDPDQFRGNHRFLTQNAAYQGYNKFLENVPFDSYVQMMGAQGAARGMSNY